MEKPIKLRRQDFASNLGKRLYDEYFRTKQAEKRKIQTATSPQEQESEKPAEQSINVKGKGVKRRESPRLELSHAKQIRAEKDDDKMQLTLIDLLDFYKERGLVGEEKTCILQTLGAIHQLCFGIESLSGSGKSFTLDILLDLLPEDYVYVMKQSSDKAALYDSEKVNKARVLVITELQKSSSKTMIEILKDLGEGKSAERIVTNGNRNGVIQQRIDSGKAVIYTLAIENWFKKDRELERRYFQLYTDISEEQTRRILERIAEQEACGSNISPEGNTGRLRNYIRRCIDLRFDYVNPFAQSIIEQMPLKIKSRSFAKHYFDLVQACVKFHHRQRLGNTSLFANLEDVYIVHTLYAEQFFKSVQRVPIAGEQIVEVFDDEKLSAEEVYKRLRIKNSGLGFSVVGSMLEELTEAGYLERDSYSSKDPHYSKIQEMDIFETKIDWQHVWDAGCCIMGDKYPALYEKWASIQSDDGAVFALNPIKRSRENLAGADNGNI